MTAVDEPAQVKEHSALGMEQETPSPQPGCKPERRHYLAVGAVSCALILLQVSFTRLIGYKLFSHFVFLARKTK